MQKANVLTVQSSVPSAFTPMAGAPGALKWMWVAIGGLGACVVAMATVLVMQHTGNGDTVASAAAPVVAGQAAPALASSLQQGAPAAGFAPNALNASSAPGGVAPAVAAARPVQQQPYRTEPVAQRTPVSQRPASVCKTCGQVESVQAIEQAAPATGVGAVAGGVLGAVVGNQIGKGNGRTAATLLGAVGGGYAGHEIEKRTRTHTTYQVRVRMDDGSSRVFTRAQPPAVGTPVVLQGNGFRVADERAMPPVQQPQPPQYQTVSQPGYVAMQQ